MPMALSQPTHSTPHKRTLARTVPACGYELSVEKYVSRLCSRPATTVLRKPAAGSLYLCRLHATEKRIQEAIKAGWTVNDA